MTFLNLQAVAFLGFVKFVFFLSMFLGNIIISDNMQYKSQFFLHCFSSMDSEKYFLKKSNLIFLI